MVFNGGLFLISQDEVNAALDEFYEVLVAVDGVHVNLIQYFLFGYQRGRP
jgi:hypothetical protein